LTAPLLSVGRPLIGGGRALAMVFATSIAEARVRFGVVSPRAVGERSGSGFAKSEIAATTGGV
jgi:hypothetical protein